MKTLFIFATLFILVGIIGFVGILGSNGWDFSILDTSDYETETTCIEGSFTDIVVDTKKANVTFLPSVDDVCRISVKRMAESSYTTSLENGTLTVFGKDQRPFYKRILSWGNEEVTVYLPKDAYESLTVKISTGDIKIYCGSSFETLTLKTTTGDVETNSDAKDISIRATTGDVEVRACRAESLNVTATTGNVSIRSFTAEKLIQIDLTTGDTELEDVNAEELSITATTGDTELSSVYVQGSLRIKCTTGDVDIVNSDAGEVFIKATTGEVDVGFRTDKIVYATSSTGKIDVPELQSGGICEIETTTGSITVTINK